MGDEPAVTPETPATPAITIDPAALTALTEAQANTDKVVMAAAVEDFQRPTGPVLNLTLFTEADGGWVKVSDEVREQTGSRAIEIYPIKLDPEEPVDAPNTWLEKAGSGIVTRVGE